jgi:dihydroxy-acid dehydratase
VVSAFEAVGQLSAGRHRSGRAARGGAAAPAGQGVLRRDVHGPTPCPSVFEAMGMSLPGSSTMAARKPRSGERRPRSGRCWSRRSAGG